MISTMTLIVIVSHCSGILSALSLHLGALVAKLDLWMLNQTFRTTSEMMTWGHLLNGRSKTTSLIYILYIFV